MATHHIVPSKDALRVLRRLTRSQFKHIDSSEIHTVDVPRRLKISCRCSRGLGHGINQCASWTAEEPSRRQRRPYSIAALATTAEQTAQPFDPFNNIRLAEDHEMPHQVQETLEMQDDCPPSALDIEKYKPMGFSSPAETLEIDEERQLLAQHYLQLLNSAKKTQARATMVALLNEAATVFTTSHDPRDWHLFRKLFANASQMLPNRIVIHMRQELVEKLLHLPNPRVEVLDLLMDAADARKPFPMHPVNTYLQLYCYKHTDFNQNVDETANLVTLLQYHYDFFHPDLFVPCLHQARGSSQTSLVHQRIMQASSETNSSHLTVKVVERLIKGYAASDSTDIHASWARIDQLLEHAYSRNFARRHSFSFSCTVRTAVNAYSKHFSPTRVYDFLMRCIKQYGLLPSMGLYKWVLMYFTKSARLDLCQDWINAIDPQFPSRPHPLSDPAFLAELETYLQQDHISCRQIWLTLALTVATRPRTPSTEDSSFVIRNLLVRKLQHQWLPFRHHIAPSFFGNTGLSNRLGEMTILVPSFRKGNSVSFSIAHNMKVIAAVDATNDARRVLLMLTDFHEHLRQNIAQSIDLSLATSECTMTYPTYSHTHKWLHSDDDQFLTEFEVLFEKDHGEKQLLELLGILADNERFLRITILLSKLYLSDFRNGLIRKCRGNELFKTWLFAVSRITSWHSLRHCLWALLDSTSVSEVPSSLLVLLDHILRETEIYHERNRVGDAVIEEIRYLHRRIFRRWWQEHGCPGIPDHENSRIVHWHRNEKALEHNLYTYVVKKQCIIHEPAMKHSNPHVRLVKVDPTVNNDENIQKVRLIPASHSPKLPTSNSIEKYDPTPILRRWPPAPSRGTEAGNSTRLSVRKPPVIDKRLRKKTQSTLREPPVKNEQPRVSQHSSLRVRKHRTGANQASLEKPSIAEKQPRDTIQSSLEKSLVPDEQLRNGKQSTLTKPPVPEKKVRIKKQSTFKKSQLTGELPRVRRLSSLNIQKRANLFFRKHGWEPTIDSKSVSQPTSGTHDFKLPVKALAKKQKDIISSSLPPSLRIGSPPERVSIRKYVVDQTRGNSLIQRKFQAVNGRIQLSDASND